MKIGFINLTGLKYITDTPYKKPLGGSESGMCYLAEELAKRKHEVILFTHFKSKKYSRGVLCYPADKIPGQLLRTLDVIVVQNSASGGLALKSYLNSRTKLIFWTEHAHDQPAVACLLDKKYTDVYDAVVVISKWQKDCYLKCFPIDPKKYIILRNAISPKFQNLFVGNKNILKVKQSDLVYSSTPFRGLDILIRLFPAIREQAPDIKLNIYSSMKVYQTPQNEDEAKFGELYRLCKNTAGVDYLGSVSQTQLAKKLRTALVLAYPNTFAETSCIAVMEAMAAGCKVITSRLGALPETTAGFAKLIKVDGDWDGYIRRYYEAVVDFLHKYNSGKRKEIEIELNKQVKFVNKNYTWKVRAGEWEKFLTQNMKIGK